MAEITDLMHEYDGLLRKHNAERAQLMDSVGLLRAITDEQARIASQMDRMLARLVPASIEETEGEGGPRKERKRASTNLETHLTDLPAKPPVKKEKAVREMSGELVVPGSGKRGCSNCKRTGHRAKNCPN